MIAIVYFKGKAPVQKMRKVQIIHLGTEIKDGNVLVTHYQIILENMRLPAFFYN